MENVEKFNMVNSSVGLPLKLTGRHIGNVVIKDSSFTTLPWYIYNMKIALLKKFFFLGQEYFYTTQLMSRLSGTIFYRPCPGPSPFPLEVTSQ